MNTNEATGAASLTTSTLVALGISPHIAAIIGSAVGLGVLAIVIAGQAMAYLPVADANSSSWYRIPYGIVARLTGNRLNNSPVPPSGLPAGGIVPAPPPVKTGSS